MGWIIASAMGLLALLPASAVAAKLDSSFGEGGKAVFPLTEETEQAVGMEVDSRDRIVVAFNPQLDETSMLERQDFTLKRFLPDGQLDPSFGEGGSVITDLGGADGINQIAIDAADRIIAGGYSNGGTTSSRAPLVRYLPDGSLDPSFGDGGAASTAGAEPVQSVGSLTLDDRGRILVVGSVEGGTRVSRFANDGALDRGFRRARLEGAFDFKGAELSAIAAGPGKRITLAGDNGDQALVMRLLRSGEVDSRFGEGGARTYFGSSKLPRTERLSSSGSAIAFDRNGRVLVAGTRDVRRPRSSGSSERIVNNFFVLRVNGHGDPDRRFGDRGAATFNFGCSRAPSVCFSEARSMQTDGRGRIVVGGAVGVGGANALLGLARLTRNGALDESFSRAGRLTSDFGPRPSFFRSALDSAGRVVASASADDPLRGLTLARFIP